MWEVVIRKLSSARLTFSISFFQSRYLPLALGQKVFHLPLIEGLGWSAGQRGKRDHPGVGEGLCT